MFEEPPQRGARPGLDVLAMFLKGGAVLKVANGFDVIRLVAFCYLTEKIDWLNVKVFGCDGGARYAVRGPECPAMSSPMATQSSLG